MQGEYCLQVENITKIFPGTIALSKVKLQVKTGEVHALVGENGAGKSTLMNIISGVLQPDEGTIQFQGETVQFTNPREAQAAGVGFVHQELALCPHISVAENIYMGRYDKGPFGFIKRKKLYADTEELVVNCRNADVIVGPVGIAIADSLMGEITPAMAKAVGQSRAKRILIPLNRCNTWIAGINDLTTGHLIQCVIDELARL